jgi:hypothetical protein
MNNDTQQPEAGGNTFDKLPEDQRTIIDFTLGKRAPANEAEQTLYDQIKEIERKGYMVELPFD